LVAEKKSERRSGKLAARRRRNGKKQNRCETRNCVTTRSGLRLGGSAPEGGGDSGRTQEGEKALKKWIGKGRGGWRGDSTWFRSSPHNQGQRNNKGVRTQTVTGGGKTRRVPEGFAGEVQESGIGLLIYVPYHYLGEGLWHRNPGENSNESVLVLWGVTGRRDVSYHRGRRNPQDGGKENWGGAFLLREGKGREGRLKQRKKEGGTEASPGSAENDQKKPVLAITTSAFDGKKKHSTAGQGNLPIQKGGWKMGFAFPILPIRHKTGKD